MRLVAFSTRRYALPAVAAVVASLFILSLLSLMRPVDATLAGFNAGNIIDDVVMSDKDTLTEAQIQAFLTSKNPCNDSNLSRLSGYNATKGWINSTLKGQPFTYEYNLRDGKFLCLSNDTFNGKSAAKIIWDTAQDYRINPQVLIVLLQKEQGLVTDTWPNQVQYRTATGFGCPDTADCSSQYFGLEYQVRKAAELFREVLDGGWTNYPVGDNYIQYNPDKNCGGSIITIQNRATSALYRYTPYQPNSAALAAGWGSVYCGAYGNRNFYNYFTEWFGSTRRDVVIPELSERYEALGGRNGSLGRITDNGYCDTARTVCWQSFANGSLIWSPSTGAWESKGGIRDRWAQLGYQSGILGYPVSSENWDGKGWWQSYQNGAIIGTPSTGYWESMGGIRDRWAHLGYQTGTLGYPKGNIVFAGNGNQAWQQYENGYIVWGQSTGAWESKGGIRDRWAQLGYQAGKLGFPTGAETWDGKGWSQSYERGSIVGSDATGYWESSGTLRFRWQTLGAQTGAMGYPTGPIVTSFDNKTSWQQYENGYLYWTFDNGTWESKGGIREQWAKMGYATGQAGAPTGPETYNATTKTWSQTYQNGTIYYSKEAGGWYQAK